VIYESTQNATKRVNYAREMDQNAESVKNNARCKLDISRFQLLTLASINQETNVVASKIGCNVRKSAEMKG
jgi:hypothetical protein